MAKPVPPGQGQQQVPIQQALQNVPVPENWKLIDDLEQALGAPIIALYIGEGGMLRPELYRPFSELLESIGNQKVLGLFLRSTGGITEVPWKLVSLLREYTDELKILVPDVAHSGATHIALAGDSLIMTELATLSSVDPTRRHPLLPKDKDGNPTPMSVEDLKHCVDFVRRHLGESHQGSDMAAVISELFRQVHPLSLGAIEQSAELSKLITRKVLGTRRSQLPPEQVEQIVEQLAGKYFSHSFPISRSDARNDLGLPVTEPGPELKQRMEGLVRYYEGESRVVNKQAVISGKPGTVVVQAYFVDTARLRRIGYGVVDGAGETVAITWKSIQRGGPNAPSGGAPASAATGTP